VKGIEIIVNNLTVYWFPFAPTAWGICGLDEHGNLHLNPSIISESCRRAAFNSRALSFLKIGEEFGGPGMVGLVSMKWLKRDSGEPNDMLTNLRISCAKLLATPRVACAHVPTFLYPVIRLSLLPHFAL
jgi:hypothetical protein